MSPLYPRRERRKTGTNCHESVLMVLYLSLLYPRRELSKDGIKNCTRLCPDGAVLCRWRTHAATIKERYKTSTHSSPQVLYPSVSRKRVTRTGLVPSAFRDAFDANCYVSLPRFSCCNRGRGVKGCTRRQERAGGGVTKSIVCMARTKDGSAPT